MECQLSLSLIAWRKPHRWRVGSHPCPNGGRGGGLERRSLRRRLFAAVPTPRGLSSAGARLQSVVDRARQVCASYRAERPLFRRRGREGRRTPTYRASQRQRRTVRGTGGAPPLTGQRVSPSSAAATTATAASPLGRSAPKTLGRRGSEVGNALCSFQERDIDMYPFEGS